MGARRAILMLVIIIAGNFAFAETKLNLTQEEGDYIAKAGTIKAVSSGGVAPLQYMDSKGEIEGIAIRVLEEIADITGLVFEYELYDSADKIFSSDYDLILGISEKDAIDGVAVSKPYLKAEIILYMNSSLDSGQLGDKTYAAIKGTPLPEGVNQENSIYYETKEESISAVDRGEADYGCGNAYSLAFYMLKNSYRNIVTIPKRKELREYCMGVPEDNEVLLSILNKAIDAIDEGKMQTLVLDVVSQVDRKITFSMMMDTCGKGILGTIFLIIIILLASIVYNVRSNKKLKTQNKINEMLAQISNEYLYKYSVKTDHLELSGKHIRLFGTREQLDGVAGILKNALLRNNLDGNIPRIRLPLANGGTGIFKSVALSMDDEKGKTDLVVGKITDISEEIEERKKLIKKSKLDGLTGLYNPTTVKELINGSIKSRKEHQTDALIVMDCDKFKYINDTYGHLTGDRVLKNVGKGLRLTFRQNDIIGRIGGDEFCAYMKDVSSADSVQSKCRQLNKAIQKINKDFHISVSSGIAFSNREKRYEELFEKADNALYEAKKKGGGQSVVYTEEVQRVGGDA